MSTTMQPNATIPASVRSAAAHGLFFASPTYDHPEYARAMEVLMAKAQSAVPAVAIENADLVKENCEYIKPLSDDFWREGERLHQVLTDNGGGLTTHQVSAVMGYSMQKAYRRLKMWEGRGLVENVGRRFSHSGRGNPAIVWWLTGKAVAEVLEVKE